jgi:hypothetical protein
VSFALVMLFVAGCGSRAASEASEVSDTAERTDSAAAPTACDDAEAHIAACEGGQGDSYYRRYVSADACWDTCTLGCIQDAPCEELSSYGGADTDDEDCPLYNTGLDRCIYDCEGGCVTPLALAFDGAPIVLGAPDGTFDFGPLGRRQVSWPGPANPWLVLDRNGNGTIDDATELFGDATIRADGERARNGFEALAALDGNGDGRISPADPAWPGLRLWSDDGDRVSTAGELQTLDARGLTGIALGYSVEPRCDAWGNCERERSRFGYTVAGKAHEGAVVDVYLRVSRADAG